MINNERNLAKLTQRKIKCIVDEDLKVGGWIDYIYYDEWDGLVRATYPIRNGLALALLEREDA